MEDLYRYEIKLWNESNLCFYWHTPIVQVSFRPPFYSCQGCNPEEISGTFTKEYTGWYDDDYISEYGQKRNYNNNQEDVEEGNDDANNAANNYDDANAAAQTDDGSYYQQNDDTYNYAANYYDDANNNANDDANNVADDGYNNHYVNTDDQVRYNYQAHDDDFYGMDDDNRRRGLREGSAMEVAVELDASHSLSAKDSKKVSQVKELQLSDLVWKSSLFC